MATPRGAAEELAAVLSFLPDASRRAPCCSTWATSCPTSQYDTIEEIEGQAYREPQATARERARLPASARGELDSAPLPSYDLEEVGAAEAMSSPGYDVTARATQARGSSRGFPASPWTIRTRPRGRRCPKSPPTDMKAGPLANANWGASSDSVEDALEEAEFFLSRGLLDDARAILEDHCAACPNHPLLLERLRELDLDHHPNDRAPAVRASARSTEARGGTTQEQRSRFRHRRVARCPRRARQGRARPSRRSPRNRTSKSTSKRSSPSSRPACVPKSRRATAPLTTISVSPTARWVSSTMPSTSSRSRRAIPSESAFANR